LSISFLPKREDVKLKPAELQAALELLQRQDWKAAHEIVQKDEESPLACWAHGIVHLMEGDISNARYWYREAKRPFDENIPAELAALSESLRR
jgi:Tfp pilus assembly protein PilF